MIQKNFNMEKVSCLTITNNRLKLLKKSIQHFLNQTYKNRELIIVYYNTDENTKKWLITNKEYLNSNNIFFYMFVVDDGLHLGAIRNYGIKKTKGDWICIWDDDDWFSPFRIEKQMIFCQENKLDACTLRSIMIYSDKYQELKLSYERSDGWEGSLLVKKLIIPKYHNAKKGEDTPVVMKLISDYKFLTLFDPELYVYIFHDKNISGSRHKQKILDASLELDIKKQREFKNKIGWI